MEGLGRPDVIAVEGDVLPSERCDVGDELIGNGFAAGTQLVDGASEIDGVLENDGGDREIEARSAVALILESPIADFAEAMKEHGPLESVVRLALVEAGVGAAAQGGVADPVEREQSALQASDFPQRLGEAFWRG